MPRERATRLLLRFVIVGTLAYGACHGLVAAPPDKVKARAAEEPADAKFGVLGMLFGSDAEQHLVVVEVAPNSAAGEVGVQKKDILLTFDGQKVADKDELIKLATKTLAAKKPGEEIEIVVQRAGRSRTLTLIMPQPSNPGPSVAAAATLDKNTVFCMVLKQTEGGRVVVQKVLESSPPHQAGIQAKDVIVTFGVAKISSIDQLRDALRLVKVGEEVTIGLVRGNEPLETRVVIAPCSGAVAAPAAVAGGENLERLAAKLQVLQAQIEELRITAAEISATVDALRTP